MFWFVLPSSAKAALDHLGILHEILYYMTTQAICFKCYKNLEVQWGNKMLLTRCVIMYSGVQKSETTIQIYNVII